MTAQCQQIWTGPTRKIDLRKSDLIVDRTPKLRIVGATCGSYSACVCQLEVTPTRADHKELPSFDPLEEKAISFGATDPITKVNPNGRIARIFALLFGVRSATPLADPQLEALRRLVLALRGHPRHVRHAVEHAAATGISSAKIEHLVDQSLGRGSSGVRTNG